MYGILLNTTRYAMEMGNGLGSHNLILFFNILVLLLFIIF
ncbi:protein of unknown function [Methanocaldococcus lauensis]|nr:protein of unknown function [Methanocaldococcus lauensis]